MTPDQFTRTLREFRDHLTGRAANGHSTGLAHDEAEATLGTTIEELTVAGEEIRRQHEELIQTRDALERERHRYRELFELAPDLYLVTDLLGLIREANAAAIEMLNLQANFLVGKPLVTFIPEEGRPAFRSELARIREGDGRDRHRLRLRLRPRRGAVFHADASVAVILDWRGVASGLRWLIRDITALEAAQAGLRDLNAELERRVLQRTQQLQAELMAKERLLIETHSAYSGSEATGQSFLELVHELDAIIWKADAETGRYTFVSRQAEPLLGHPAGRWLAEPDFWAGLIHPEDVKWAVGQRRLAMAEGRDHELEYRLMAADGRAIWFREGVRVLRDEAGKPCELRGLMVNISRRKKVERQLYTAKGELTVQVQDLSYLHDLSRRLVATRTTAAARQEVLDSVAGLLGADRGVFWMLGPDRSRLIATAGLGLRRNLDYYNVPANIAPLAPALRDGQTVIVPDVEADPPTAPYLQSARLDDVRSFLATPLRPAEGATLGVLAIFFADAHRPPDRQVRLIEHYADLAADFLANSPLPGQ